MKFVIDETPIPKRRHRMRDGKAYDPQSEKRKAVSNKFFNQMLKNNYIMLENVPIAISMIAYMPIPKSIPKSKISDIDKTYHHKKPDIDNIAKFYLDAMNTIVFADDNAVSKLAIEKRYTKDLPKIEISVETLID